MKRITSLFGLIALCMAFPLLTRAQDNSAQMEEKHKAEAKAVTVDKSKAEGAAQMAIASTPTKVQVIFTEYDGDKKTKSLPYILYITAPHAERLQGWSKLRIGSKVPVFTGRDGMQYLDVGTNIDARVARGMDDRFILQINVERSWVEGEVLVTTEGTTTKPGDLSSGPFKEPIIRQFKSELDLSLRDGQTVESTMATDPLSGKVLRVEITLNITK